MLHHGTTVIPILSRKKLTILSKMKKKTKLEVFSNCVEKQYVQL